MKRTYLSALAALSFATSAFACGADDFIGSICTTSVTNFCPIGTLTADGSVISIQQYAALYTLIGHVYDGGSSQTTFGLPNLSGRTPVGYGQVPGLSGVSLGQKRGQESVTLTANNLSAHTHPFVPTTGNQNVTIPATTGSGTTLSGKVGVVPDTANTAGNMTPSVGTTYRLAGTVASGSTAVTGPYTNASLPTSSAYVSGVSVDASGMTPTIPAKTVTVQTLTGGAVGANSTVQSTNIATIPPQLGLRYCIVWDGVYPYKP